MERAQDVEDRSIGLVLALCDAGDDLDGRCWPSDESFAALGRQMLDRLVDDLVALLIEGGA